MDTGTFSDYATQATAREHVLTWGMGYTPSDTERTTIGGWLRHVSGIAFKHHHVIQVASQMAEYGLEVVEDDISLGGIERWWGISLTPDQWRIPPDEWCEQRGLTSPLEAPTAEVDGDDMAACQAAYVAWIREFWSNTTHSALVTRLADALPTRQTWAGADIAAFLDEAAQALGPGAIEAPV